MHHARNFGLFCLGSLAACLFLTACTNNQNAQQQVAATQPAATQPMADPQAWVHSLEDSQKELARLSAMLPGRDKEEQQHLMAHVVAELRGILPTLHGPYEDGVFDQQMRILDDTHRELTKPEPDPVVAPTIDTALRASADALAKIQSTNFSDRPEIAQSLAQLQQTLGQLDEQPGPLHAVVEANAVDAIAKTVQAMNTALAAKI